MEQSFHYMLMADQALVHKRLLSRLKGSGLSLGQPKILDYLGDHEGASQKEIAAGCHIEAASLTPLLTRMEEQGILERRSLNGNRRTYHIYLTDKGAELQKLVQIEFERIEEEAFCGISDVDRAKCTEIMTQICRNLSEISGN